MTSFFTLLISVLIFSLSTNSLASDMGGFNVAANKILAGPTAGGNATASYRYAVAADIPALPYASSTLATGSFYIGVANVATAQTATQATAALNLFTAGLPGLAPASGGGAVNFLRADGTWAAPAGSGTVTSVSVATVNGFSGTVATATTTPAITIIASGCNGICKSNATTLSTAAASDVTGQLLTGFSAGAGVVAAADSILQGINKIVGNIAALTFASIGGTATVAQTTVATSAMGASAIDWSLSNSFSKTLGANTTITFSNQTSGQTIVVRLTNTGANYTVTWPGGVLWSGGSAPTQTIGAKSDVYTFFYDGSTIYGSAVQNF